MSGDFFLAGLTCTEETFMIKAGAQRVAAREGLILITPDTSPRGANIPGDSDAWDFGVGAGFYLDAVEAPWSAHYRMESYIVHELRTLLNQFLPIDQERLGIMGHSMGGHGALTLALRHPGIYKSLSAFAPIAAPTNVRGDKKRFVAISEPTMPAGHMMPAADGTTSAGTFSARHTDRPGRGRSVSGESVTPAFIRNRLRKSRATTDFASACRL
jgi:S-formylglutathione hydrolase FrmB